MFFIIYLLFELDADLLGIQQIPQFYFAGRKWVMECFACEVVSTITDYYSKDGKEGKELVKNMLLYLYHTTTDDKLKQTILDWFNEEQYCISCGEKLIPYEYCEVHDELPYDNKEWLVDYVCPVCDRGVIEEYDNAIKEV